MPTLRKPMLAAIALALSLPFAPGSFPTAHGKAVKAKVRSGRSSGTRAQADGRKGHAARATAKAETVRVCKGTGRNRKCAKRRSRGRFSGRHVAQSELRATPRPRPSGDVWAYSPNNQIEVRVNIYNPDGSYNQEALARLDVMFRCRRTHEVAAVDPRLYEILSMLGDHFGERIDIHSGFRFQRNEGSRHFSAAAMDIRVPNHSYREVYQFTETLDLGGMGVGQYPRESFVHVDFRAPGEPSFRWTDTTGPNRSAGGRTPSMWRRPNS